MVSGSRRFVIKQVDQTLAEKALAFHREQVHRRPDYLLPRSDQDFAEMVEDLHVFAALSAADIVGLCYIHFDGEKNEYEFGGVSIHPNFQGIGLGAVLGKVAVITAFVDVSTPMRLIAHVHASNTEPRALLPKLGFVQGERRVYSGDLFPKGTMERDPNGDVVGDEYTFNRATCSEHAAWLKSLEVRELPEDADSNAVLAEADVQLKEAVVSIRAAFLETVGAACELLEDAAN